LEANTPKLVPNEKWGQEFKIKDMSLKDASFIPETMTVKDAIAEVKKSSYD
jgi:hypothetical protein